jgi:hypothetical protein
LVHFYGKYDPDNNGITSEYQIICEKETWTCILCRVNPYDHGTRPVRQVKFLEKDGSCDGMGVCELIYRYQIEANDNRNKMADVVSYAAAQMKSVRRGANIDKRQLKPRPGGFCEVRDHGDIELWKVDLRAVEVGIMLEKLLKEDIQTITGATTPIQGTGPGAETLGQSQMLLQRGLEKAFNILERVERDMLQETYRLFYQLTLQYMDRRWDIPILGRPANAMRSISKLQIFMDADFIPQGSKYMKHNYLQRQQDITLLSLAMKVPRYIPFADVLFEEIAKGSGRGAEFKKAMKQVKASPVPGAEQGQIAQQTGGLTPQPGSTSGMNAIRRGAGNPPANQSA